MVSFQALDSSSSSPNGRNYKPVDHDHHPELDNSSKKRKWDNIPQTEYNHLEILTKKSKTDSTKTFFDIDLHLETPLPSEWQRCLDIQSGQIHFYNARTQKRTSRDPRRSPEPASPDHHHQHMSLDLGLNLPCETSSERKSQPKHDHHLQRFGDLLLDSSRDHQNMNSSGLTRCPSWLAMESDQQEMVATVCTRCHMLVMLCKSSPACPNCKFVHPLEQSSTTAPKLLKERPLSLLC